MFEQYAKKYNAKLKTYIEFDGRMVVKVIYPDRYVQEIEIPAIDLVISDPIELEIGYTKILEKAYIEHLEEEKMRRINIGDRVMCIDSGVVGTVVRFYVPTACSEQTLVMTDDSRLYHAPTELWDHYILDKPVLGFVNDHRELAYMMNGDNIGPEKIAIEINPTIQDRLRKDVIDCIVKSMNEQVCSGLGLNNKML